jgi:hypothetical protein
MRALARDPAERYGSARELSGDLARFAAMRTQVVGAADVADWVRELFPAGRERRQQVLDLAAQLGPSDSHTLPGAADTESSPAAMHAIASADAPDEPADATTLLSTALWRGMRSRVAASPPPPPATPNLARARRHEILLLAGGLVLVSSGVGATAALVARWMTSPAPSAAQSAASSPEGPAKLAGGGEIVLRVLLDSASSTSKPASIVVGSSPAEPENMTDQPAFASDLTALHPANSSR